MTIHQEQCHAQGYHSNPLFSEYPVHCQVLFICQQWRVSFLFLGAGTHKGQNQTQSGTWLSQSRHPGKGDGETCIESVSSSQQAEKIINSRISFFLTRVCIHRSYFRLIRKLLSLSLQLANVQFLIANNRPEGIDEFFIPAARTHGLVWQSHDIAQTVHLHLHKLYRINACNLWKESSASELLLFFYTVILARTLLYFFSSY